MGECKARLVSRDEYYENVPSNVTYLKFQQKLTVLELETENIEKKKSPFSLITETLSLSKGFIRLAIKIDQSWNYFTYDPLINLIMIPVMYGELVKRCASKGIVIDLDTDYKLVKYSDSRYENRSEINSYRLPESIYEEFGYDLTGQYYLVLNNEIVSKNFYIDWTNSRYAVNSCYPVRFYIGLKNPSESCSDSIRDEIYNYLNALCNGILRRKNIKHIIGSK